MAPSIACPKACPEPVEGRVQGTGRDPSTGSGHAFRAKVLTMLKNEGNINQELIEKLMNWRHSGFSVHVGNRIAADDRDGQRALERGFFGLDHRFGHTVPVRAEPVEARTGPLALRQAQGERRLGYGWPKQ